MEDACSGGGVAGVRILDPCAYFGQLQNKHKCTVKSQDGAGLLVKLMDLEAAAPDYPLFDEPDASAASISFSLAGGVVLLIHFIWQFLSDSVGTNMWDAHHDSRYEHASHNSYCCIALVQAASFFNFPPTHCIQRLALEQNKLIWRLDCVRVLWPLRAHRAVDACIPVI